MAYEEKYRLAIFDLDGTLVDSAPDVHYSMNLLRAQLGLPPLTLETAKKSIGPGPDKFVQYITPEQDIEQVDVEKMVKQFRRIYSKHLLQRTRLFPGMENTIHKLYNHDILLIVVTNKPSKYSKDILKGLKIDRLFIDVIGPEDVENRKPAPDPILKALQIARVKPSQTVMFGDTEYDIHAAKGANVDICAVGYGYTIPDRLKELNPTYFVQNADEILSLFQLKTVSQK